jgi:hypothetical protein
MTSKRKERDRERQRRLEIFFEGAQRHHGPLDRAQWERHERLPKWMQDDLITLCALLNNALLEFEIASGKELTEDGKIQLGCPDLPHVLSTILRARREISRIMGGKFPVKPTKHGWEWPDQNEGSS